MYVVAPAGFGATSSQTRRSFRPCDCPSATGAGGASGRLSVSLVGVLSVDFSLARSYILVVGFPRSFSSTHLASVTRERQPMVSSGLLTFALQLCGRLGVCP